ncbi:MAG: hypothetical protein ABW208_07340 [Pyrinomonadaceae bacterium]
MLIYDIEIHNAIPDRNGERDPEVRYCEGWNDHRGMGIAVIGCYDYASERMRVFCSDNLADFGALIERHDIIVGFNNWRFDDLILAAHGCELPQAKSYDLLQEVYRGLGLAPGEYAKGYRLDDLAAANLSTRKVGAGALAPVQWQRGQVGTVIDYCLGDVHLTKKLLDRVIRAGRLIDPNDSERRIPIRRPGAQV